MNKELTTTNNLEMLATLRNTVAPGLTDSEFVLFTEMVKATGLNPVTKEIWAIKAGGRLQVMTGINGFLKIANSHPQFDGMEVSFEWEDKNLISATAKVYRKDRRFPSVATAYMAEYAKPSPIWKQMPSIMLSKCAKSLAIREAFIQELGGLYTQEEMPGEFSQGYQEKKATQLNVPEEQQIKNKRGEVIGISYQADQAPEVLKEAKARAKKTRYDLSSLTDEQRAKAVNYLEECLATCGDDGIWTSPIRLERLTSCIVEEATSGKA